MPRRGLEIVSGVDPIRGGCEGIPEVIIGAIDRDMSRPAALMRQMDTCSPNMLALSPVGFHDTRKQRFLGLALRQGHTRALQPLSSPPRLPCRFPGPGPSVASLSRPEPHLSRVCKLTRAHNYPHTHITDHRRRRHALPLHTCSNTAPPKHSPAQSSHGPPFGSRGSPTAAAPLGSFQCVSCTPRQRCSRELQRPPRRVLKP